MISEITRYEINEQGELPLSYGRYVRWEDVENLLERIEQLEDDLSSAESPCCNYDAGYHDGKIDGVQKGIVLGRKGVLERLIAEFKR